MATTSPLPPNWSGLLDQIDATLTQSVQLADERESSLNDQACPIVTKNAASLMSDHLEELANQTQELSEPLLALDRTLLGEEDHVRKHLTEVADLSRRLADWVGRAVG